MTTLVDRLNEKYELGRKAVTVPIKCTSTSPFRVQIAGVGDPVDAVRITGQSFAVDDVGTAWWSAPNPPICFKTF